MTTIRRNPQLTFLALAILINIAASIIAQTITDPARHRLVAFAASLDMTFTVTALYYWLIVRPGLRPKTTLIFIALMGLLRASFAFPDVIPGKAFLGAGAELTLLAAIVLGFRKASKLKAAQPESDPAERIRAILAGIIPFATAERALTGELSVLYYAFAWRAKPHIPAGAQPFTLHKKSILNDILLLAILASFFEAAPVHILIARWSATTAWILTGLTLYGMLWITALRRSLPLRPSLVTPEAILIRFGLLFSLRIPVENIRTIGRESAADATLISRRDLPNLYVEFTSPLEATKLFGFTKRVYAIGLSADDPEALEQALRNHAQV